MYRMAKWLNVSERTIQARLEKHDQTTPHPHPTRRLTPTGAGEDLDGDDQ